ncbi:MAG: PIG-L family deacetylase [Bryobacteraceae bacterium]
MRTFILLLVLFLPAQGQKNVLVVTAGAGDYLMATGGTLAKLIDEGYEVRVVQFANDEKNSVGLNPAQTRLANSEEAEQAARMLGIREIVNLNHKSGELGQVSSNEMRNQIFALIRFFKPEIIFHPDPFIHYEPDWDQFWIARMSEESSYGSSSYFLAELGRMGFPGYGVRETYYYATNRPYRPGEGGHNAAAFRPVDISATFNRKAAAIQALRTANHRYATHVKQRLDLAGKPSPLLTDVNEATTRALVRAYAEELAETIGGKHGFRYGEEFNWHGRGKPIPEHVRERAKPVR